MIHETAIIYPGVFFESEPQVDPYAIVGNKDKSPLEIGKNARIGYHSIVRGNTSIGDNFTLGSMSSVEGNPCRIGNDVTIRGKIEIPSATIGNRVQIYIWTTFYDTPNPPDGPLLPPEIQDDVVLCADVRILGGVTVGKRSFVSAGAFVKTDVPPDSYVTRDGRIKRRV